MILVDDIKIELRIPMENTEEDLFIEKKIGQVQNFLKGYCRNELLDFDTDGQLDLIVLYLVCMYCHPDTRLSSSVGKTSENMGVQMNFLKDLPKDFQDVLRYQYVKLNVHDEESLKDDCQW